MQVLQPSYQTAHQRGIWARGLVRRRQRAGPGLTQNFLVQTTLPPTRRQVLQPSYQTEHHDGIGRICAWAGTA